MIFILVLAASRNYTRAVVKNGDDCDEKLTMSFSVPQTTCTQFQHDRLSS